MRSPTTANVDRTLPSTTPAEGSRDDRVTLSTEPPEGRLTTALAVASRGKPSGSILTERFTASAWPTSADVRPEIWTSTSPSFLGRMVNAAVPVAFAATETTELGPPLDTTSKSGLDAISTVTSSALSR